MSKQIIHPYIYQVLIVSKLSPDLLSDATILQNYIVTTLILIAMCNDGCSHNVGNFQGNALVLHHKCTHILLPACLFMYITFCMFCKLTLKPIYFYNIEKHVKHTLILKVYYVCYAHITDFQLIAYQRILAHFIHETKACKTS